MDSTDKDCRERRAEDELNCPEVTKRRLLREIGEKALPPDLVRGFHCLRSLIDVEDASEDISNECHEMIPKLLRLLQHDD